MTKAERDTLIVRRLDEYKDLRTHIACLSSSLRETFRHLATIDHLLYSHHNEHHLCERIDSSDFQAVDALTARLRDLRQSVERKGELATEIEGFGYGELLGSR